MKISQITLVSSIFFLISPLIVIGIDPTTGGRIINNFKEEQYNLLFEYLPFDQTGATQIYEKEYIMNGIVGLKKRLDEATEKYQEKKDITTQKRVTLEEALNVLESSISETNYTIRKTEKSIQEQNILLDEYQDLSIELSSRIKQSRSIILSYIANIYTQGNLIFDDSQDVDIFQTLVLTDTKTDQITQDILYKTLVSILGQRFIEDYRSLVKEYRIIQLRIKEELAKLDQEQLFLGKQKETLLDQYAYREQLLEATKGQEELYQSYIDAQLQTKRLLEESWRNAAQEYTLSLEALLEKNGCSKEKKTGSDIEKCGNILAFYRNERALNQISLGTGTVNVFRWPVSQPTGISAYFKDPSYFRIVGAQHDAIDIPVNQGTDVLAAGDGYIQYINPPTPGGYSFLAIKHPDGYVTVYGHLSDVSVFPYQFVQKGDKIGKSGGAPGTPGAGPMTSGAHLHFEVWKDKEPLDPLRVLDISVLEYETLPARYQDKFIRDIVEKSGTGVNTSQFERKFILRGNTEIERQKFLLKTYATPDFQSYDLWLDTAIDARIDPSFLICVGLAETTLGNNLKTSYNVGNVGNTDSGDIVSFSSPKEGVAWMASTFNNRYLSHYNYVSDLSRWGNPDGTIYASSNANWHNNIIRCLSSLKGRFVEDKYPFRINADITEN